MVMKMIQKMEKLKAIRKHTSNPMRAFTTNLDLLEIRSPKNHTSKRIETYKHAKRYERNLPAQHVRYPVSWGQLAHIPLVIEKM